MSTFVRSLDTVARALQKCVKRKKEIEAMSSLKKAPNILHQLLTGRVTARVIPAPIPYNPLDPLGRVGKDVELLEREGCHAAASTLRGMLQMCSEDKSVPDLLRVHNHIVQTERCEDELAQLLMQSYGACGLPDSAVSVFRGLEQQNMQDWRVVIGVMRQGGRHREAFCLFREMIFEGVYPHPEAIIEVLKACAEMNALVEARLVHFCVRTSFWFADLDVLNQLIQTYDKLGAIEDARHTFDNAMQSNLSTWINLLTVYSQRGLSSEVLRLFFVLDPVRSKFMDSRIYKMALNSCSTLQEARAVHAQVAFSGLDTEARTASSLSKLYARLGSMDDARLVFESVENWDLEWWEAMVEGYARVGDSTNLTLFYQWMNLKGVKYSQVKQAENLKLCRATTEMNAILCQLPVP